MSEGWGCENQYLTKGASQQHYLRGTANERFIFIDRFIDQLITKAGSEPGYVSNDKISVLLGSKELD